MVPDSLCLHFTRLPVLVDPQHGVLDNSPSSWCEQYRYTRWSPGWRCWNENWTQESPPAWTQEAHRPLCSKYSLWCPIPGSTPSLLGGTPSLLVGTPSLTWHRGTPSLTPRKGLGTSHWGTPLNRKDMEQVEVLWDGDGVPPKGHGTSGSIMPLPQVWRDTPVKIVPSRRTTYAGGRKLGTNGQEVSLYLK